MTTRGRTLAALAASMLVFGRLTGLRELVMAGSALALVLIAGGVLIWLRAGRVRVERRIYPARTVVGHPVRVELSVDAEGRLGMGPVLLSDRLPAEVGPTPRLALPGGMRRRRRAVAYTISPRMRGRHPVGPLEVTHTDPFGAVRRRQEVASAGMLLVYPSHEEVSVLPSAVQRLGIVRSSPLVGHGDEFYTLRSYEEGDDPRKIHWPSTLRTGNMLVRQEELLAEPRALIVLDTSASKHAGAGPDSSLEAAVSACASLGVLAMRRRMRVEIVTSEGPLLRDRVHNTDELLEALAVVRAGRGTVARALERAERPRAGRPALVVVITPDLRKEDARAIAMRARHSPAGALVWIDASSFEDGAGTRRRRRVPAPQMRMLPFPIVPLRAGDSFRHVWHKAVKDVAMAR